MSRKNEESSRSRFGLVLGLPGLLLIAVLFYAPAGRLLGSYAWLLVDWCVLQTAGGLTALGMSLFRRRRSEILWALYFFLSAALPLILVEITHPHVGR